MPHHLTATIDRLIALSNELATARRWDDVKACQDAAMQLSALRDQDAPAHPLLGHDDEFDAESFRALTD